MRKKKYKAIGLMSGSSLDGLDIAFCEFNIFEKELTWSLITAETIPFSEQWVARLAHLPHQSAKIYAQTDIYLGYYFGELCLEFMNRHQIQPDFIASHGHTIFHDPGRRFTAQIGDGAAIAGTTGVMTIDNFRNLDIALDGEGAPIAPIADQYLLPGYDFYLNLGGIVNISCQANDKYIAFDISGANQVLNRLAQERDLKYDENGQLAASGQLITSLLNQADRLPYLSQPYPKSLSNQWVQEQLVPLFVNSKAAIEDRLHTMIHHIAKQIKLSIEQVVSKENLQQEKYRMIMTGGGAYNGFLVKTIKQYLPNIDVILPDNKIIDFKEAALIALMGTLRIEQIPNTINSVTGAKKSVIAGAIHAGINS
jgi:anhydro-N-acetylmuramic acid kinase